MLVEGMMWWSSCQTGKGGKGGSLWNVEMGERVCGSVQEVVVVWMVGVEERMVDEKRGGVGRLWRNRRNSQFKNRVRGLL